MKERERERCDQGREKRILVRRPYVTGSFTQRLGILDVSYLPLMAARVIRAEDKRARNKIRTGSGTGLPYPLLPPLSLSLFFVSSREKGNVSSESCDLMTRSGKSVESREGIRGTRSIWRERERGKIFRGRRIHILRMIP